MDWHAAAQSGGGTEAKVRLHEAAWSELVRSQVNWHTAARFGQSWHEAGVRHQGNFDGKIIHYNHRKGVDNDRYGIIIHCQPPFGDYNGLSFHQNFPDGQHEAAWGQITKIREGWPMDRVITWLRFMGWIAHGVEGCMLEG